MCDGAPDPPGSVPGPPPTRYRHPVIAQPIPVVSPGVLRPRFATLVAFFANGLVLATWIANIPTITDRLALDPTTLGLDIAATAPGALVSMQVSGWLVARRGSAWVTKVSGLAFCAALAGPFLARDALELGLALFILGAMSGAMDVSMNAQAVHVERLGGRPIMSSFHAVWSCAGLLGGVLGSAARVSGLDPNLHAAIVGVLTAVSLVAVSRWYAAGDHEDDPPVLLALPRGAVLGLGIVVFCGLLSEGAIGDWSALYLRNDVGASAAFAPLGFAIFSLAMAAGRLTGDRVVAAVGAARVMAAGGVLVVAGLGAALWLATPEAAIAGFVLVAFGICNTVPVAFSAAGALDGVSSGVAIAGTATIGYLGLLAGPSIIGFVAGFAGLPRGLLVVVAAGAVIGLVGPRLVAGHARR